MGTELPKSKEIEKLNKENWMGDLINKHAHVAQPAEHRHGKSGVIGSIPIVGLIN